MNRGRLVTLSLIAINIIVYVLLVYHGNNWLLPDAGSLLNSGANFSGLTLGNEWWRLFTCIFVHVGILHLAVNMFSLYSLGMDLEEELGSLGFLLLYLTCGLAGSISSVKFNDFTVSVGASGAVFGLFGVHMSFLVMGVISGKKHYFRHLFTALIMLTLNLALGLFSDFIDNAAHLGGLVAGLLGGGLFLFLKRTRSHRLIILSFVSVLISSACLIIFLNASKFPAWYYSMFTTFFQNEKEASRVLNDRQGGTDDNAFKLQLEEADRLWSTNQQMIDSFPFAPLQYQNDIDMLSDYCKLKKEIFSLYLKSLKYDSYLFIDSAEYVNYKIGQLPPLQFRLDFFSKPSKEEKEPSLYPITVYFDKDWHRTEKRNMLYFRLGQEDSLHRVSGRVKDYYRDSTVQMKGDYTEDRKDGIFFYYFPNGWYESAGMYNNDVPAGKWQRFYANRQMKLEERYGMGHHTVENFWDENGVQLTKEGNGISLERYENGTIKETGFYREGLQDSIWTGFYPDGKPQYRELWKEGKLVNGKFISDEGKIHYYDTVFTEPGPEGGFENYILMMNEKTHIPVKGKKPPVIIVTVELTIDIDGSIVHREILTGDGSGFEKKALELINEGPAFRPAMLRGIPVKEKVEIPFEFLLK